MEVFSWKGRITPGEKNWKFYNRLAGELLSK
jgi:hypothetical protein